MKTIAKALITIIIIFSVAIVAGDQQTRINLTVLSAFEGVPSMSEDVRGYHLNGIYVTDEKVKTLRKVASRKKTVSRPV